MSLLEYCNANEFFVTVFGEASWLEIDAGQDCHGNKWTGIFQNCDHVTNSHAQPQTFTGYAENCSMTGLWQLDNAVNNEGDDRARADKIKKKSDIVFGSGGLNQSYYPISDNVRGLVLDDERFIDQTFVVADTDNISGSGYVIDRSGGAGSFLFHEFVYAGEFDYLIRSFGAVTISFDAKTVSGTAGAVEWSGGNFFSPSVTSTSWQRYTYTLTQIGQFLRVYIADANAGQKLFCNFSVTCGYIAQNPTPRQYLLLDVDQDVLAPLSGGGIACKTPDGTKTYLISVDNSGNIISTLKP